MKNTLITLASVATLTCVTNAQTVFSMQDSAMNASSFTLDATTPLSGTTNAGGAMRSIASGGNGGSYLETDNTWTSSATEVHGLYNYWLRTGWSYDPSAVPTNAIYTIGGSLDSILVTNGQTRFLFAKQNGNYFLGSALNGGNASTFTRVSDSGKILNLNSTDGLIEFGFATTNGVGSNGTSSSQLSTMGHDNLNITMTVPEPSSTALLGLGALGLLVRRKR